MSKDTWVEVTRRIGKDPDWHYEVGPDADHLLIEIRYRVADCLAHETLAQDIRINPWRWVAGKSEGTCPTREEAVAAADAVLTALGWALVDRPLPPEITR